jgi:hypothetical protein
MSNLATEVANQPPRAASTGMIDDESEGVVPSIAKELIGFNQRIECMRLKLNEQKR